MRMSQVNISRRISSSFKTLYSRRSGPLRVHALLRAAGGGLPARQLLGGVERRALPPRQDAGAVGQGPSEENCTL